MTEQEQKAWKMAERADEMAAVIVEHWRNNVPRFEGDTFIREMDGLPMLYDLFRKALLQFAQEQESEVSKLLDTTGVATGSEHGPYALRERVEMLIAQKQYGWRRYDEESEAVRELVETLKNISETWNHQRGRVFESMGCDNPRAEAIDDAIIKADALIAKHSRKGVSVTPPTYK